MASELYITCVVKPASSRNLSSTFLL